MVSGSQRYWVADFESKPGSLWLQRNLESLRKSSRDSRPPLLVVKNRTITLEKSLPICQSHTYPYPMTQQFKRHSREMNAYVRTNTCTQKFAAT